MNKETEKLIRSLFFPAFLVITLWLIKLAEIVFGLNLTFMGIYPLNARGLAGIIFAPLIHADLFHLAANTGPLFFLSAAVFYFYRRVAWKVIFLTWLFTGIWVWFGAREAYHIGASGLVYGYASFIFFSGIIRSSKELMAISLIVVFLYGGLVWGIFPIRETVSWESHLLGGIAGLILSVYFREYGPARREIATGEDESDIENISGEEKETSQKDNSKPDETGNDPAG